MRSCSGLTMVALCAAGLLAAPLCGNADASSAPEFFPNSRMFDRGCLNCHSQIHGSNHPAGMRFLR